MLILWLGLFERNWLQRQRKPTLVEEESLQVRKKEREREREEKVLLFFILYDSWMYYDSKRLAEVKTAKTRVSRTLGLPPDVKSR